MLIMGEKKQLSHNKVALRATSKKFSNVMNIFIKKYYIKMQMDKNMTFTLTFLIFSIAKESPEE